MSNGREEIREWLSELFGTLDEGQPACALIALNHYANQGAAITEIFSMKSGSAKWGQVEMMAEVFDRVATKHAGGLSGGGAQQFQLEACFGTDTVPKRFLPFHRQGAIQFANGVQSAAGALVTEPPTASGMAQQGQRLLEIMAQGTMAERQAVVLTMATMIKDLHQNNRDLQAKFSELFLGYQKLLADTAVREEESRIKLMTAMRNSHMALELMKMSPALINAALGKEVFPMAAGDTTILRFLGQTLTPEQLKDFAGKAAQNGPEAAAGYAAFLHRLEELQKQEQLDAVKMRELQRPTGVDPELDAAGLLDPSKKLYEVIEKKAEPAARELTVGGAGKATDEDEKLLDDLFAAVPPGELGLLIGALASKDAGLARRLKARAARV